MSDELVFDIFGKDILDEIKQLEIKNAEIIIEINVMDPTRSK